MDRIDREILCILQHDATLSVSHIAEQVNLSLTPCWRRIQSLEKKGIIQKRVALLSAQKLGLNLTVFVQVKASQHDEKWFKAFAKHANSLEEVTEFYRMSGDYDYLLKVQVSDMQAYDIFYKKLISGINLSDVTSSFAMEEIKNSTALPMAFAVM